MDKPPFPSGSRDVNPDDRHGTHRIGGADRTSAIALFGIFLRLGLTSFGGPVAHLGYFRDEFVGRRRWFDDSAYSDIVALCQFLPGPSSSQVGIAIGGLRGGAPGALAAWLGFTLPSALLMIAFAAGLAQLPAAPLAPILHGLKLAAVAVVAHAVWSMAASLCPDRQRATLAVLAAIGVTMLPTAFGQLAVIAVAGVVGRLWLRLPGETAPTLFGLRDRHRLALGCLALFSALLFGLPWLAHATGGHATALFASLYRVGSLVFGGGHVVLPLLQSEVVAPGWVTNEAFLAGYGLAQAVPGPLFTFAAFLGAIETPSPNGLAGGVLATVAIFLPSLLLVGAALPLWDRLRASAAMRNALAGVNAAVVGLLLAALYDPVWTHGVTSAGDFAIVALAVLLLGRWRVPACAVVGICALVTQGLALMASP